MAQSWQSSWQNGNQRSQHHNDHNGSQRRRLRELRFRERLHVLEAVLAALEEGAVMALVLGASEACLSLSFGHPL